MPLPVPHITDPIQGLPEQRIPLRYAVLITGLSVVAFTELMTNRWENKGPLLEVFEYSSVEPRKCRAASFTDLIVKMHDLDSERERLKLLPSDRYVLSTALARAFTAYLDLTIGREVAAEEDLYLNWNPPLGEYASLLKASAQILSDLSELPQREIRRRKTMERHQAWFAEYKKLEKRHPEWSLRSIAMQIARQFEGATSGTVRRVLTRMRKNS